MQKEAIVGRMYFGNDNPLIIRYCEKCTPRAVESHQALLDKIEGSQIIELYKVDGTFLRREIMKSQVYNLNPHKPARVAMVLYNERYASQGGGSIDFWNKLTEGEKDTCRKIVSEIESAPSED